MSKHKIASLKKILLISKNQNQILNRIFIFLRIKLSWMINNSRIILPQYDKFFKIKEKIIFNKVKEKLIAKAK
jgi:hypothetical protein